jgi:hypothetical protein
MAGEDSTSEGRSSDNPFEIIAPLTGEDPNLGSFFLVVGAVTCVFIAVFQFTLPEDVAFLLTAGVLLVTILSAIVASLLETLGFFDQDSGAEGSTATTDGTTTTGEKAAKPWTPTSGTRYPLPPILDFDEELRTYYEMFDGDLPGEFDEFLSEYKRLKTTKDNRVNVASDLRADLNPIAVLFEDGSRGAEIHDDIGERLLRYIDNDAADHLSLADVTFYDEEGNAVGVRSVDDALVDMRANIENAGEAMKVEVVVEFVDSDGAGLRRDTSPIGEIAPGATETFDARVYVPAAAERAVTSLRVADTGVRVADV